MGLSAGNLVYILLAGCLNVVLRLQYHLIKGRVAIDIRAYGNVSLISIMWQSNARGASLSPESRPRVNCWPCLWNAKCDKNQVKFLFNIDTLN